jgi:long-chain acyl-CoA synthetase
MEIVELGRKSREKYRDELETIKGNITSDDWATLIYTSGTTGMAKGVMLSHKILVENFKAASLVFGMGTADKYLSILPLCHVGGRMGNYQTQYSGSSIYYAESMATIASDMKEIHADGFDTVPRILEKIFDNVIAKGNKLTGIKKKLFFWAVRLGLKFKLPEDSTWIYRKKHSLADKLIFSKWREALGGKIRLAGCGGASLQPRLERVFWAAGIRIINMYGLTETSPVITINRQNKPFIKLGSVGCVIDGVEVKIAGDGEILSRGHNIMKGYYKDDELTRKVIDKDGWFYTGDIGRLDAEGFLFITDRKKDVFKLSNGKFISPQMIEGRLKESLFIEQSIVVGEQEKFASALIVPDFAYLRNWCQKHDYAYGNQNEMISLPQVKSIFSDEIKKLNKQLNPHEQINRFKLIPDEWSPESGELSPTLKLRRTFILTKYASVLAQIYPKTEI